LEAEKILINEMELRKISFLQNPKDSLAICEIKESNLIENCKIQLGLDGIQDPGNMGTIIRLADWFGIEQIICSQDTVDFYNPKVIQASMGSFTRVNIVYEDIKDTISNAVFPVFGTAMEGENIYEKNFPENFSLVLGNEGNGIRPEIFELIKENLSIPRFGKTQSTESLNVSVAAAIILGEVFSRK
jgi:TrmH family RNA methyltransferase